MHHHLYRYEVSRKLVLPKPEDQSIQLDAIKGLLLVYKKSAYSPTIVNLPANIERYLRYYVHVLWNASTEIRILHSIIIRFS